ncbi:MAG: hypothetical protein KDK12_02705 [Rhodobacteraceae bacterium]|nr:hypothetical protein [Paracoccaceae bacterium]
MRLSLTLVLALTATAARADLCDYRLSQMVERRGSPAIEAARAANAAPGDQGPVLYLMVNPRTGQTSLGATGAGTPDDGFLTRTARLLGSAVAIVSSNSAIATAGGAVAGAGLEAVCFFRDERITDYDEVLAVLRVVDESMPPDLFALIEPGESRRDAVVRLSRNDGYDMAEYAVDDLYIVNGQLRHRDWGLNDVVGDIAIFLPRPTE